MNAVGIPPIATIGDSGTSALLALLFRLSARVCDTGKLWLASVVVVLAAAVLAVLAVLTVLVAVQVMAVAAMAAVVVVVFG